MVMHTHRTVSSGYEQADKDLDNLLIQAKRSASYVKGMLNVKKFLEDNDLTHEEKLQRIEMVADITLKVD